MNVCAVIPSYDPDHRLVSTVANLQEIGFQHIIVVDDGSQLSSQPYFDAVAALNCKVIHLAHNCGKGTALKTGFLAFLTQGWTDIGVITVDGDGQHSAQDALCCAIRLNGRPNALILGGRDFSGDNVPAKSKKGNHIMTFLLNKLCHIPIRDTQTGLRAIPASCLTSFSGISGERYEYETNMLLYCKQHHIPIEEFPISTIYIDDNAGSHYHPVKDSLRIGLILCRWYLVSLLGPLAGLAAFWYAMLLGRMLALPSLLWIWLGVAMSGILSEAIGFAIHHTDRSQTDIALRQEALRYASVTGLQMVVSGLAISFLYVVFPGLPILLAKIVTDLLLLPGFSCVQDHTSFSRALAKTNQMPDCK